MNAMGRSTSGRQGILTLSINDKNALYAAFMGQIKEGGLFIATPNQYQLGDEVFVLLSLMEETEKIPLVGRVVWITPRGAQGNRTPGIGVQFSEKDGGIARKKIDTYLAGTQDSDRPTHTL
jgi:type IV pilus assembly protein PilZ